MASSWFSITSFIETCLRRSYTSSGLSSRTVDIDEFTTIHLWAPAKQTRLNSYAQKPNLLLLHGFGPSAVWQWRRQVLHFSPHFNVYVPDLIFFGSSTTRSSQRSESFQAECVKKVMDKLGVERFSIVGTSYGGFVAYRMAAMWPESVEAVVLASSAVNMVKGDNEKLAEKAEVEKVSDLLLPETPAQLRTSIRLAAVRNLPSLTPDFLLNDCIRHLYTVNRAEKLELLKDLAIGSEDTSNISPLRQGVLIVWGDKDNIFPLKKAVELKEILGDKARLEVIKDVSHIPQIERSEEFNKIVHDFLCGWSTLQL